MARNLLRHDSKSSREYLESLMARQEEHRNVEQARVSRELYYCREGETLTRILRRAGVIDERNRVLINPPTPGTDCADEGVEQTFHHVPNPQFRDPTFYKALSSSRREIRLVELLPATPTATIRCKLVNNVSLTGLNRSFSTLSYVVGDVTECKAIRLSGTRFLVTKNLEAALRHMRHRKSPIRFWVDQICINQTNHRERTEQVMLMREIYNKSSQTLIWIGGLLDHTLALDFAEDLLGKYESVLENMPAIVPNPSSSLALLADMQQGPALELHRLSEREDYTNRIAELLSSSEILNIPLRQTADYVVEVVQSDDGMAKYRALVALDDCPYWRRSWIWQEVTVSFEPVLVCGSKRMHWGDYILAMRLVNAAQVLRTLPKACQAATASRLLQGSPDMKVMELHMVRELWWRSSLTLRQMLGFSRGLKATDTRDKVYGMLSMVSETYRIMPDYTPKMSPAKLFLLASKRSILIDNNLDILSDAQEPDRLHEHDLPSWVPDFSVVNRRKQLVPAIFPEMERDSQFCATLDTEPLAQFIESNKPCCSIILRLSGASFIRPFRAEDLGIVGGPGAMNKWGEFLHQRCPFGSLGCLPASQDDTVMQSLLRSVMFGMKSGDLAALGLRQEGSPDTQSMKNSRVKDSVNENLRQIEYYGFWRFFFVEDEKIMGMVPAKTAPRDRILFLFGSKVPYVARRKDTGYELVGPCYVHGYMYGRIMDEYHRRKFVREEYDIY